MFFFEKLNERSSAFFCLQLFDELIHRSKIIRMVLPFGIDSPDIPRIRMAFDRLNDLWISFLLGNTRVQLQTLCNLSPDASCECFFLS